MKVCSSILFLSNLIPCIDKDNTSSSLSKHKEKSRSKC